MGWLNRLLGRKDDAGRALYQAVVAQARAPHWYLKGAVPDTVDGRFDMIAAVLSVVLLRLEVDPAGGALAAAATERFVDDMDAQLRQGGIGDMVVGKHMGRLVAMLGGRLGAYRDGLAAGALEDALARNLYRGAAPGAPAVAHVRDRLIAMRDALATIPLRTLEQGALP